MAHGVLVDITRCIGCRSCQVACKQWQEIPAREAEVTFHNTYASRELHADCYTRISFLEKNDGDGPSWHFVKNQCLHCLEPACASACPVGALQKSALGPVIYDQYRCIGCRYCMIACPFQIPKYEWDSLNPWVRKCDFCADRLQAGLEPACIKACPMEVMLLGEVPSIRMEAEMRLKSRPDRYVDAVYGFEEAGGTSWIYIADRPFEELGFETNVRLQAYPDYTWASLSRLPWKGLGLATALSALAVFRNRGSKKDDPS